MGPRRFDTVVILVKSQATETAFASIRPALEGRAVLVTLQNGVGNAELLEGLCADSMAQDIEAGRETELEAMTGYVVRKAKELGVPMPVTESVYRMAKGVEYAANARRAKR